MSKKPAFILIYLAFHLLVAANIPSSVHSQTKNQLIQSIQFSSPHDKNSVHSAELFQETATESIILKINGKITNKVNQRYYRTGTIMLNDLTNDNIPEILFYQYSTGSGGAIGLHIYSLVDGVWQQIFKDPNEDMNLSSDRFKVENIGNHELHFFDNETQLSGTLNMSESDFTEQQLKNMEFQTDPICEYIIYVSNCGQNQIESVQWIFAFSHPHAVFSVHNVYTFEYETQAFILSQTKIYDQDGRILAQKNYQ